MSNKTSYSGCGDMEKRAAKMCGGKMHRDKKMYGGAMGMAGPQGGVSNNPPKKNVMSNVAPPSMGRNVGRGPQSSVNAFSQGKRPQRRPQGMRRGPRG